jgi:hypothetical protein
MALIKKIFHNCWTILEEFGRARAAASLAREGKYDQARKLLATNLVDK